jgi:succinyl-CoA synthetase beta subunit
VRRTLWCALSLWCSLSWAQTGPSIAPFPVNLRRVPTGFTAKNEEALGAEVRKAVRDTGASVPNAYKLSQVFAELKRQDCDLENECLSQFAVRAETLYGLYVSIDLSLLGVLVVSGRVVRSDGVVAVDQKSVSRELGKDAFATVAMNSNSVRCQSRSRW